jgi:type I restriction-modification system DNA methylase subunit
MNLSKLKAYAPQARRDFIQAMKDRAMFYGLTEAKIEPIVERGEIAVIVGREHPRSVAEKRRALEERIRRDGFIQTMEALAYTWFNRFVAIHFMELHGYLDHGLRVLSHPAGRPTPEILEKAQHVDLPGLKKDVVIDLKLAGNKDQELYRRLLVAQCNALHQAMPFLFEQIGDETELLLPDNLLNTDSLIRKLVAAIDEDDWKEVEIIGWLYQFYISERKEEVFAGLKKNQKITPENIPAATQLFTPHWIVRYLVENSLGRLWLLNHPDSKLADKMPYYIEPAEPETNFIRISSPEEIRICDPACGSGHMLTYAFDLLCEIYKEAGYAADEIAPKILANNLVGIEIDDRAGALAAFALAMKAAEKLGPRQFLWLGVKPDICVLQNVHFTPAEMQEVAAFVGRDLFTSELQATLGQFEQAKNFGSLIVPKLRDPAEVARVVRSKNFDGDLLLREVQERVSVVLRMAMSLAPNFHVLITNPPYANSKGLNQSIDNYIKLNYPDGKTDLMTCFMERAKSLTFKGAYWGLINLPSWMFISSFEKLRINLVEGETITSLLHLGRGIFGADFGTVALVVFSEKPNHNSQATYRRLFNKHVQVRTPEQIERLFLDFTSGNYITQQFKLAQIPGNPIAYWVSDNVIRLFESSEKYISNNFDLREGINTGDNERFLRLWHEVSDRNLDRTSKEATTSIKWKRHRKGGRFRKWYGNGEFALNWGDAGQEIHNFHGLPLDYRGAPMRGKRFFFREAASWTRVSSGDFAIRHSFPGESFDSTAPSIFECQHQLFVAEAFLNGPISRFLLGVLSQTIDFRLTSLGRLPLNLRPDLHKEVALRVAAIVTIARADWDAYETSWDFTSLPLLISDRRTEKLRDIYAGLRDHWRGMTEEMQRLEEENNRIFIEAYGLQDELTSEVPLAEVTLTCNPTYRYGGGPTGEALETRLLADTMREFISNAIGCMFGRYSFDEPGLILANQGDGIEQYLAKVPKPKFAPNADNIIPLLDRDRGDGDATTRFHAFLRVTFGDEHFEENLAFVETAIGKDVRKFFLRDFFADHLKRYKKRPIYWLFSSGPERAFQALVYLHRYDESTLARMRTEYILPLQGRMGARIDQIEGDNLKATSTSLRKKLQKEQDDLKRQKEELKTFEERLRHIADQRIALDLDDGVKANYAKFGDLLAESRAIVGAEDDE